MAGQKKKRQVKKQGGPEQGAGRRDGTRSRTTQPEATTASPKVSEKSEAAAEDSSVGIAGAGGLGLRRAVLAGLIAAACGAAATALFETIRGVQRSDATGGTMVGAFVLDLALLLLAGFVVGPVLGLIARGVLRAGFDPGRPLRNLRRVYSDPDADRIGFVATYLAWFGAVVSGLLVSFRLNRWVVTTFHEPTLMAILLVALAAGIAVGLAVVGLVVRPALAGLLRWWERSAGGPPLSRPRSFGVPAAVLLPVLGVLGGVLSEISSNRELLSAVDFGPLAALAIYAFAALAALVWVGRSMRNAPPGLPGPIAFGLVVAQLVVLAVVGLVALEGSASVRAVWSAGTILGGRVGAVVQSWTDGDGDGYSDILGGGDCDDTNPIVHPGGLDIPGNGRDENCNGADAVSGRTAVAASFAPLPDFLPPDLDVLLISIDAVRPDHLGAYGYARPTSPVIDALARRGVRFTRFYAGAPSTRYGLPIMMTSLPLSLLEFGPNRPWPPTVSGRHVTLAEVLRKRGVSTMAAVNLGYPRERWGLEQGFDLYDNTAVRRNVGGQDGGGVTASYVVDRAIAMLETAPARGAVGPASAPADSPRLFTWVHFYDPHHRYERPPGVAPFGTADVDRYDAEIKYVDTHLGRLMAHLTRSGRARHTAVILTSDHGEAFGEHGKRYHGYDLYDVFVRIPLIISLPGAAGERLGGRSVADVAGAIDIAPTVLNLMGLPPAAGMLGRSLVGPAFGTATLEPRPVVSEVFYRDGLPEEIRKRALTDGSLRLLHTANHDIYELFDLATDPEERNNLASTRPDLLQDMRTKLAAWSDSVNAPENLDRITAAILTEMPTPGHPSDAVFASAVELLGADLAPVAPVPGAKVKLTLYFKVLRPLEAPYRVFVHLTTAAGDGRVFASGDHEPVGGVFPTDKWRPGDIIKDEHSFRIPPRARLGPGPWALYMGLYRGRDRVPLAGTGVLPDRRVRLMPLTFQP